MSTSPQTQSRKRRHILSSINPEAPSKRRCREGSEQARDHAHQHGGSQSPPPASKSTADSPRTEDTAPRDDEARDGDETTRPRRTRLKLKKEKSRRRHRSRERDGDEEPPSRRRENRHHRHRRRHRSPTPPNPHDPEPLDPEAAFRESLFDAMADDEGAAYWEGVYGQPVHVYGNEKVGPEGELERMTEEEYAAHVRQRMWEKTHAGLLEERARREEARKKKKEEEWRERRLRSEMDESLRRGEARRRGKMWATRWAEYVKGWADWDGSLGTMAWPLESGRRGDINEQDVRTFFVRGLELDAVGEKTFVSKLRDERVRWHPDKVQQRLGGQVDEQVMRDVTAIFQIIDRLWADSRGSA